MPLELGLFLGARRFGDSKQRGKSCLILDSERYRYQKFCSDIAGQDIRAHSNDVESAIVAVRNWLHAARPTVKIPSPKQIAKRYVLFRAALKPMCRRTGMNVAALTFLDYQNFAVAWLKENSELTAA